MTRTGIAKCFGAGSGWRGAVAFALVAAIGLGVLPFSVERPLFPATGDPCRFEPIDVCGASDSSLGMLADTPLLLPDAPAVFPRQTTVSASAAREGALREGFPPGVYRPPRARC